MNDQLELVTEKPTDALQEQIKFYHASMPEAYRLALEMSGGIKKDEMIDGLVPVERNFSDLIAKELILHPEKKETFEALIYSVIAESFEFLPEKNIYEFVDKLKRNHLLPMYLPDCSKIASNVEQAIENAGGKAYPMRFRARNKRGEWKATHYVTFIHLTDRQGKDFFYVADQAAWFYGSNIHPWYSVIEGTSVEDIYDRILDYFQTSTKDSNEFDKATWQGAEGDKKLEIKILKSKLGA